MSLRNPEKYGAFGRIDPRMKKLLANIHIEEKKPTPIEVPISSNPVAPRSRIADHGCHDFGELHRD